MVSILTPIIIHIIVISLLLFITKVSWKIFRLIEAKSTDVWQYKVKNIYLSIVIVGTYIKVFIFFLYCLRLYNYDKMLDLKLLSNKLNIFFFLTQQPYYNIFKLYLILFIMLIVITLLGCFIYLHKKVYKEIHKLYIYFAYKDYLEKNKYTKKLFLVFQKISINDLFKYFCFKVTSYITIKISGKDHYKRKLPWYHIAEIYHKVFENNIYKRVIIISPLFVILYDCIFNNLILVHVYIYLIFYIPLRALQRVTTLCASHAPYIGELLWEIYYKEGNYLYAVSPKYKPFLEGYFISGVFINIDLGSYAESFLYEHVCFNLVDKKNLIFQNIEGIELKCINGEYFELREDEDGNVILWEKWHLLADKTKNHFVNYEKKN